MRVVLVGGGGHASDVLEAYENATVPPDGPSVIGILDDGDIDSRRFAGRQVAHLGGVDRAADVGATHFVLAAGWPGARRRLLERLAGSGLHPASIVDPGASVHESVAVGAGAVVLWGAHVSAGATIGEHVLISHGALIGHDCRIGDFVSVMPGAAVSGDTRLEDSCMIGTHATVREGIVIGANATLAAGAVAVGDVPAGVTARGVPARW